MSGVVVSGAPQPINIGATGLEEIFQNVRIILGTVRGTVPLDRPFGVSDTVLDEPLPEAVARLSGEIVGEVEKQEPRVKVISVHFLPDADGAVDGRLYPVVEIEVKDQTVKGAKP